MPRSAEVYALNDPEKVRQQKARLEEERKVREKMQATIDIQAKEIGAAQIAVPAVSFFRSNAQCGPYPRGRLRKEVLKCGDSRASMSW